MQSNERVAGGSVAHLEAEEQRALVEAQRALVEALLEAVTERQAGVTVEDFGRGYEIGLAYAAIVIGVEEAAFPQRETQLPAWLAAHPEGSD